MPKALLSVSDKTGLVPLADALVQAGIELLSTGGTARVLREAGLSVTDVSEYTGFPEMMDGRVKTLHPKVHGGILARRGQDDATLAEHGIAPIDWVIVNLYPFVQTVANPDCSFENAIEHIDIGGPTMIRASAKNHAHVHVLVDPSDYATAISALSAGNTALSPEIRKTWAHKAFMHTAHYDAAIANYLHDAEEGFAPHFTPTLTHVETLRYGENPHQSAALYRYNDEPSGTVAHASLLHGKPLSYNNIADADAALRCVKQWQAETACVIVKHANPCGVAIADTNLEAYQQAFACDSTSAFGGIIAFNHPLDAKTAETILSQQFVEVIVAPSIPEDTLTVLQQKKNIRVLACGDLMQENSPPPCLHSIEGGVLIQTEDMDPSTPEEWQVVTEHAPSEQALKDLRFAWSVVQSVKSNAIVFAKDEQTVGIGAGQMNRVISTRIASWQAQKAGLSTEGAVMASDAFFPFSDSIEAAAEQGITAIIQPGGSIRDAEVIAAANAAGIAMVFTGVRHFRH